MRMALRGVLCALGLVYAQAAAADPVTGDDYVERALELNGTFVCNITMTLDMDNTGNVGTPLTPGTGWQSGGPAGADIIDMRGLSPAAPSGTSLVYGGNQYTSSDGTIFAVAEVTVAFDTNCPTGVLYRMNRTASAGANPGAEVWYNALGGHQGTLWQNHLTFASTVVAGGVFSGPAASFSDGTVFDYDLSYGFAAGEQNPGATATTITASAFPAP